MGQHHDPLPPPGGAGTPAPDGSTTGLDAGGDRSASWSPRARISASLAVVVAGVAAPRAAALVAEVQEAAPDGARQEYLLLDDHTDPARRDLVAALDGIGDAMRLVPRPSAGRAAELDALSLSARSEFLVFPFGDRPPLGALVQALQQLWSQGADVVSVMGPGVDPGEGDSGSRLVEHLGFGSMGLRGLSGDRVVVIRRWVARWLFSEMDRAIDPGDEMADRARLLGLDLLVVDEVGARVR